MWWLRATSAAWCNCAPTWTGSGAGSRFDIRCRFCVTPTPGRAMGPLTQRRLIRRPYLKAPTSKAPSSNLQAPVKSEFRNSKLEGNSKPEIREPFDRGLPGFRGCFFRGPNPKIAGLNVAQVSLYRRLPACRTGACLEISEILNTPDRPIQSEQIAATVRTPCRLKTCDTVPQ